MVKFEVSKTTDSYGTPHEKMEFNTLDELLTWIKKITDEYKKEPFEFSIEGIIISYEGEKWFVEIYDGYRE